MLSEHNFEKLHRKTSIHFIFPRFKPFAFLLIFVWALVSCGEYQQEEETGTLVLNVSSPYQTQTLLPDIDMVPANYDFFGSGPNGSNFSVNAEHNPVEISKLVCGDWTITVNTKNADNIVIAQGEETTILQAGTMQTVTIQVTPVDGYGTVDLTVYWTAGDVNDPSIEAQLIPYTGSPIDLDFVFAVDGTATCIKNMIPTGYHTLVVKLLDNGILTMGAVEIVRVVQDQTTSGVFEFYEINQAGGDIDIRITPEMNDKNLGEIIKEGRWYKEFTRADLEEFAGVSEENTAGVEDGSRIPDFDTMLLIKSLSQF